jgi:hypothetical protein
MKIDEIMNARIFELIEPGKRYIKSFVGQNNNDVKKV